MFSGYLSWLFNLAFTLVAAYLLTRRIKSGRLIIDLIVFIFFWIFLVTLFLLVFGLAGFLAAKPLGFASFIGLVILFALPPARKEILSYKDDLEQIQTAMKSWWWGLPRWVQVITTVFITVSAIRGIFLIWALPPFIWDSLTYHLTNVAQWIQDQRISVFITPVDRIYTPANYEVFAAWFAVFLHHDVIIEASGLPAYLVAGLSVYAIGRSLEVPPWASWIATLGYLSTPALTFAVTGTKNDPLIAGLYLMSLALVIHISTKPSRLRLKEAFGPVLVLVIALLYAVGTKAYIVHLLPGVLLAGILFSLRTGDSGFWFRVPRLFLSEIRKRGQVFTVIVVMVLCGGLFLGSYWYIRNWILMGNPFYPYIVDVGGTSVPKSEATGFQFGLNNLLDNLGLFAEKFGDKQYRITPDLPNTTGWGWIAYGMGIPASLWAFITNWKFRIVFSTFVLSLLGLFASSQLDPYNMRFAIWFPAILCLGLGLFLNGFWRSDNWVRKTLLVLLIFSLGMNVVMTLDYNLISIEEFRTILRIPTWERHAGMLHVHAPEEYESVYKFVPTDVVLGYYVHSNGFVYPLYRADYSQTIVYIPISKQASCGEIASAMEVRGTRYLFVAPEHSEDEIIGLLRQCAASGEVIRQRAGGLYVLKKDHD